MCDIKNTAFSVVTLQRKQLEIRQQIDRIIATDTGNKNKEERLDNIAILTDMENELLNSMAVLEDYYGR